MLLTVMPPMLLKNVSNAVVVLSATAVATAAAAAATANACEPLLLQLCLICIRLKRAAAATTR